MIFVLLIPREPIHLSRSGNFVMMFRHACSKKHSLCWVLTASHDVIYLFLFEWAGRRQVRHMRQGYCMNYCIRQEAFEPVQMFPCGTADEPSSLPVHFHVIMQCCWGRHPAFLLLFFTGTDHSWQRKSDPQDRNHFDACLSCYQCWREKKDVRE